MAPANHDGLDLVGELRIIAGFARGLEVIANAFVDRAGKEVVDPDDECAAALHVQAALVADRLARVHDQLGRVPVDDILRLDRLLLGTPEVSVSNAPPAGARR